MHCLSTATSSSSSSEINKEEPWHHPPYDKRNWSGEKCLGNGRHDLFPWLSLSRSVVIVVDWQTKMIYNKYLSNTLMICTNNWCSASRYTHTHISRTSATKKCFEILSQIFFQHTTVELSDDEIRQRLRGRINIKLLIQCSITSPIPFSHHHIYKCETFTD